MKRKILAKNASTQNRRILESRANQVFWLIRRGVIRESPILRQANVLGNLVVLCVLVPAMYLPTTSSIACFHVLRRFGLRKLSQSPLRFLCCCWSEVALKVGATCLDREGSGSGVVILRSGSV